jgi:hypothetical protein
MTRKGKKIEYTGGRTEGDIVKWVLRKSGPITTGIDCDHIKEKIFTNRLTIIFWGDPNSWEYQEVFLKVALEPVYFWVDNFSFYHINDKECAAHYDIQHMPSIVLYRNVDMKPTRYNGPWDAQKVIDFMLAHHVPGLLDFREEYIEVIFGEKRPAIILFKDKGDSNSTIYQAFKDASEKLQGQIIFATSDVKAGI